MAEAKTISDGEQIPLPSASPRVDIDPIETQEWLDSIQYVLDSRGRERAAFLISAIRAKGETCWR